nr:citramalyl-CoA lyase, mitochondrial-like [Pelodiscus sinensis]|eukprot:XP_006115520.1 citramalyl-CoA lyase, mitochondrial-like [Pelodiscus sinensis]
MRKSFPLSADIPKLGLHSKPSHKYVPRRAVLYVPADDERKIKKIPSLNVDCAVLDCEDGVALNRKTEIIAGQWEMKAGQETANRELKAVKPGQEDIKPNNQDMKDDVKAEIKSLRWK